MACDLARLLGLVVMTPTFFAGGPGFDPRSSRFVSRSRSFAARQRNQRNSCLGRSLPCSPVGRFFWRERLRTVAVVHLASQFCIAKTMEMHCCLAWRMETQSIHSCKSFVANLHLSYLSKSTSRQEDAKHHRCNSCIFDCCSLRLKQRRRNCVVLGNHF